MKNKKNKILIVEESDLIRKGLAMILVDKNNTPLLIDECDGNLDIQHSIRKSSPQILIVNPTILAQNEKQIFILKEKYKMLLVGLIYSFQHPDSLTNYDGLIYLNEKTEKIQTTINELIKSHSTNDNPQQSEILTFREKEILKLLVSGNTTKEIAKALHISTHTVNAHRKNIMRKLDIKTVSGLTIYAVLNNIITLKEA